MFVSNDSEGEGAGGTRRSGSGSSVNIAIVPTSSLLRVGTILQQIANIFIFTFLLVFHPRQSLRVHVILRFKVILPQARMRSIINEGD